MNTILNETMEDRIAKNKGRPRVTSETPPLTIVSYDWESLLTEGGAMQGKRMPESFMSNMLFMGMITNMPGHCLVIDRDGKGHWGCHPEMFFVLTDEET